MNTKITNCLLGGALGDSLGYPIEFMLSPTEVYHCYGVKYLTFTNFPVRPLISDDTQMTLFTTLGLLAPGDHLTNLWHSYQDWLETQWKPDQTAMAQPPRSYLTSYPDLFNSREPGRTCLQALAHQVPGTLSKPLNNSKGCGALMRVAPVGFLPEPLAVTIALGARSAALTHGHPLSSLAAGFMAGLIHSLLGGAPLTPATVHTTLDFTIEHLAMHPARTTFANCIQTAINLTTNSASDQTNITQLGAGWVAEEALAIALYCALKYQNRPLQAIEVAVNHGGDSDSTGALTGQIVGICQQDTNWLPATYLKRLELRELIIRVANEFT